MRTKKYKQETRDRLEFRFSFFRAINFKQKIILLLLSVLFLLAFSKITWAEDSYVKAWTRQLGTSGTDKAYGVAVDGSGNAYVTGIAGGDLDGNTNAGYEDLFLVKYDTDGNKLWTRQFGTATPERACGVAVDGSGNAYVAGYTRGSLDGNTNAGYEDLFLVKYDTDGNKLWTRQFGTATYDVAYGVAVDGSGNAYVAGTTGGGLDGNTNAGGYDLFLVKYDTNGNKLWTRQLGSSGRDRAKGVAVDGSGNAYVAGHTDGGLDGNTNAGYEDLFLVKYDTDGNKLWTRQSGSSTHDYANGVAVDGSGNAYVAGDVDTCGWVHCQSVILVKYDTDGNKLWTRQFASTGIQAGDRAHGVAVDGSGNAYVTGETWGGLDGNTNAGRDDLFLVKYDTDGNKLWTKQLGTSEFDVAYGVAVDGSGNAYVTGTTRGGLDGNTNGSDLYHKLGYDLFLVKYSPVGSDLIVILTVTKKGKGFPTKGSGTVSSTDGGISCGTDCTEGYNYGTVVTLTATPSHYSSFAGWSGNTDCTDGVVTMDEGKICTATFNFAPSADLIITAVTGPTTAVPGTTITIGATTKNQGTGTAPASTTKLYWSTNTKWDAGDILLGSLPVASLAPSATDTGTTSATVPSACSQTTWYIIARADADNVVVETGEGNNNRGRSIKVGPDLIVSAITAPLTSGAGKTVNVADTTKNQGGCDAGATTTKFYLSSNSTWDALDTYLTARAVPSLLPGNKSKGSTNVTIPLSIPAGAYYIIAVADAEGDVCEANEVNNDNLRTAITILP